MPAIGLRAFHEMFGQARSMALVGNADTILDHASGDRIDGCDLVVRFNRAHVTGIEDKVGRRTDILVANRNGNLPTLTVFAPDLLAAAQVERARPVTMGTNALYTLVNMFRLERLFLTGFT